MERLHKLFIYRKKLVRPYIEQLLKWMDIITYVMSALLIMTLVYEHGFLISFQEIGVINRLYHIVWVVFLVDTTLHLLLNYSDTRRKYRGLAWLLCFTSLLSRWCFMNRRYRVVFILFGLFSTAGFTM